MQTGSNRLVFVHIAIIESHPSNKPVMSRPYTVLTHIGVWVKTTINLVVISCHVKVIKPVEIMFGFSLNDLGKLKTFIFTKAKIILIIITIITEVLNSAIINQQCTQGTELYTNSRKIMLLKVMNSETQLCST